MKEMEPRRRDITTNHLKQRLLDGDMNASDFIEALFAEDQKTPGRDAAHENLVVLHDVAVQAKLEAEDPDNYYNLLSITEFHVGQITAGGSGDNVGALPHFIAALKAAEKITDSSFIDWVTYVRGTVEYFQNNPDEIRTAAAAITGINHDVLERLLSGLTRQGSIDYARDYIGKPKTS